MNANFCKRSLTALSAVTAVLVITGLPLPAAGDPQSVISDLDQAYTQIAEKLSPVVVRISSTRKTTASTGEGLAPFLKEFPFFPFGEELPKQFREQPRSTEVMTGSGFVVSPDGLIMTNNHVVKDMQDIEVTLQGQRDYKAKIVGADPESDIALIKIDAKNLPTVTWGNSSQLHVGSIVVAIGNPFGLTGTVTNGIVSATGRTNMGITGYEDFIQTDAPINPGNSGGPLVNIKGEVIGINTAIASQSGGYMGVGFAIPSNSAKIVMDELLKYGKVERGLLGVNIQDLNEALAKSYGRPDTKGALVSQVLPNTPAEKAGVKRGDIVLTYNGAEVTGSAQLKNLVGQEKPGATAKLGVYRDHKMLDVNVTLGQRTAEAVAAMNPTKETSNELGITVETLPTRAASRLHFKEGQGLLIKEVNPDGRGASMGLKPGDVILQVGDKEIKDTAGFNKAVSEAKKDGVIRMTIQRDAATIFLADTF